MIGAHKIVVSMISDKLKRMMMDEHERRRRDREEAMAAIRAQKREHDEERQERAERSATESQSMRRKRSHKQNGMGNDFSHSDRSTDAGSTLSMQFDHSAGRSQSDKFDDGRAHQNSNNHSGRDDHRSIGQRKDDSRNGKHANVSEFQAANSADILDGSDCQLYSFGMPYGPGINSMAIRIRDNQHSVSFDERTADIKYSLMELATNMSNLGYLEFYEWFPQNDLDRAGITGINTSLANQLLGANPKRYFRSPRLRRVLRCTSEGEQPDMGGGEVWNVGDLLYEVKTFHNGLLTLPGSANFEYCEIENEEQEVVNAGRLHAECASSSTRVAVDDDVIIVPEDDMEPVFLRVDRILAKNGVPISDRTCANEEQIGMCRPFCSPQMPDVPGSKTSEFYISGHQFYVLDSLDFSISNNAIQDKVYFRLSDERKTFPFADLVNHIVLSQEADAENKTYSLTKLDQTIVYRKIVERQESLSSRKMICKSCKQVFNEKHVYSKHIARCQRGKNVGTERLLDGFNHSSGNQDSVRQIEKPHSDARRNSNDKKQNDNQQASSSEGFHDMSWIAQAFEARYGTGDSMDTSACDAPSPLLSHQGSYQVDDLHLRLSPPRPQNVSRVADPALNSVDHSERSRLAENEDQSLSISAVDLGVDASIEVCGPIILTFPQIHPKAMYYILEYHYLGQTTLPSLEVLLLFANAVKELEIEDLINTVKDKISRSVNAETCVPIMQRSPPAVCCSLLSSPNGNYFYQWTEPFHAAWRFALSNFEDVAKSSTFLHLDAHRLEELLKQDQLNVNSEWDLYQHLLRWMCSGDAEDISHAEVVEGFFANNGVARRGHSLLSLVRWPLLGSEKLTRLVWRDKRLIGNFWSEAQPYVEEAMALLLAGAQRDEIVAAHHAGEKSCELHLSEIHWTPRIGQNYAEVMEEIASGMVEALS
eukprot:766632-Hanusia_phi.AAC.1